MTMVTQSNYFEFVNKTGLARLPDALRKGHEFVTKVTAEGSKWETASEVINRTVKLQLEKMDEWAKSQKKVKTPAKFARPKAAADTVWDDSKPKTKKAAAATKSKPAAKAKKVAPNANKVANKVNKSAPKAKKKVAAKSVKKTQKQVKKSVPAKKVPSGSIEQKPGVLVKKLSFELQAIKRFLGFHGKKKTLKSLSQLLQSLKKASSENRISDHVTLIEEIKRLLNKGVSDLKDAKQTSVMVQINTQLKSKIQALLKSAKPRLTVEFLSGVKKVK